MNLIKIYYVQKPEEEDKKNFELEKKDNLFIYLFIFLIAPILYLSLHPHISKSTYNFEKEITYLDRSQRGALVLKIEK